MNCPRCGTATKETALACRSCATARSAFRWNAYSSLLLVTVGAVDAVLLWKTVPGLVRAFAAQGQALPLSLRVLIGTSDVVATLAPWFVLAGLLMIVVMRRTKITVPSFVRNGAVLAVLAWLAVAGTLVALTLTAGHLRPAP